jgi:chromosomal replication initiator protein
MLDCITEIPLTGRVLAPPNSPLRAAAKRDPLPAFVAGPENRLVAGVIGSLIDSADQSDVAAVAQCIAPTVLVLFGPSGTGKSHLAYGLVRHWQAKLGDASALYTTAADFRHLLNDAIKRQSEPEFRADFRSRRLLAIDDLQHMPADDFAWQELRFLLDDYEDRGATVVITATESISTLANIPLDIRSRLAAGLSLQLALPGSEARTRIVQQAAHALGRPLADDVIQRLAHGINGTASTLFSALFELLSPANTKLANDAARTDELLAERDGKRPTIRQILAVVARHENIPQAQLKSGSRRQSTVYARGLVVYLARELAGASYEEIGRTLGGRDHTTIIHNYRKIAAERTTLPQTQQTLETLHRVLLSR